MNGPRETSDEFLGGKGREEKGTDGREEKDTLKKMLKRC